MQMSLLTRMSFPREMLRTVCVLITLAWSSSSATAYDQGANSGAVDAGAATEGGETADGEADEEKIRPTIDLGKFKIKDLRPTRNETAKLTFSMHLAFSKELSEKQIELLEGWKHRMRDQVITAIRIAYIKDFQEPDLKRLRRLILIRVNRLFKQHLAEDVLFGEYLFRTH